MTDGWIRLFRKIQDWEWYTDSHMVHLFIHLLLNANTHDRSWRGQTICRGQLVTGRLKLSEATGISERTIRTCLQRLIDTKEITIKTTNKFSVVTICNYETYNPLQDDERPTNDQQTTNKRPTNDQQTTTNKNIRNKEYINTTSSLRSEVVCPAKAEPPQKPAKERKEEAKIKKEKAIANLQKRKHEFGESLVPYMERYGKDMIRAFFNYWSEFNKSKTKMRWEMEKTWETSRRLVTWASRDNRFNAKNNGNNQQHSSQVQRASEVADIVAGLLAEDDAK